VPLRSVQPIELGPVVVAMDHAQLRGAAVGAFLGLGIVDRRVVAGVGGPLAWTRPVGHAQSVTVGSGVPMSQLSRARWDKRPTTV